jgi:hypothetical protein
MVQPIQYTVKAPSAFESLVSGLKLGTSLQEMQAQRALREQQALQIQQNMEQKRQQQEALNAIRSARPEDLTQEFINRYTGLIPAEQQKLMQEQFNRYDTQRQNVLAGQYGQMAQMAFSGVDDAQVNGFFDQLIAAQDSESAKKALEVERKAFLSAPDKDLYGKQKLYMLTGLGEKGKDVADQVRALNKAKTESLSSDELKKRQADADEAVAKAITAQAEARTAPEKQAADLAKARADADLKRVQAQVAQYEQRVGGGVELTPDIRTAIAATKLPPDQKESLVALAQAKAPKTTVNLPKQQEAEDVAVGKLLVKDFEEVRKLADSGRTQLANLKVAQRVLDAGFRTGFGTEWKAAAASVLSALGVKDATKFATNAQVFLAQSRGALLTKQLEQKGPQTENDAKRIDQTGAALGNTVDANRFILAHAEAIAERNIERATFWQKYRRENGTFDGADEAYAEGPGSKSIFDYAPLKKYATIIPEQTWKNAPAPNPAAPTMQGGAQPTPAATTRRPLGQILGQ